MQPKVIRKARARTIFPEEFVKREAATRETQVVGRGSPLPGRGPGAAPPQFTTLTGVARDFAGDVLSLGTVITFTAHSGTYTARVSRNGMFEMVLPAIVAGTPVRISVPTAPYEQFLNGEFDVEPVPGRNTINLQLTTWPQTFWFVIEVSGWSPTNPNVQNGSIFFLRADDLTVFTLVPVSIGIGWGLFYNQPPEFMTVSLPMIEDSSGRAAIGEFAVSPNQSASLTYLAILYVPQ